MTPDVHTACPACPIQVRALYAAAQVVAALLDQVPGVDDHAYWLAIAGAAVNLEIALQHVAPFVDEHLANQDHALSTELATARNPAIGAHLRFSLGGLALTGVDVAIGESWTVFRCGGCSFTTTVLEIMATHVAREHR